MKVLTKHLVFERSSNICPFYKSMLQTWKSIVLVSSWIWPFTHKLDTQHLSFLSDNWLQLNFIEHFSLSKKSNIKFKNFSFFFFFLNNFSEKIRGYLTLYKEYTWTITKTRLTSVLIMLSAYSIPIPYTFTLFTIIYNSPRPISIH